MRSKDKTVLSEFDDVFDPTFKRYNRAVGPFRATVHIGPVEPPQRKGRLAQYCKNQLDQLQNKFDELERVNVFHRPEDVGVNVEYVNPSFLVKKPSGGFRLVTDFADVGRSSQIQPSLMPDIDSTLRKIARWKFIANTDLTVFLSNTPIRKFNEVLWCRDTFQRSKCVFTICHKGCPVLKPHSKN